MQREMEMEMKNDKKKYNNLLDRPFGKLLSI